MKLGADSLIVKAEFYGHGRFGLKIEGNEGRILALLSAAHDRPIPADVLDKFRGADRLCRQGHRVAAIVALAHAGRPRLPTYGAEERIVVKRLAVAEDLLDAGLDPRDLMKAWGHDDLLKTGFDPSEPRLSAGNPDGGQWTTGDIAIQANGAPRGRPHPIYGPNGVFAPIIDVADFSSGFHQAVVDAWVAEAEKQGWPVVDGPAIRVVGPNNQVIGYPDLVVKRPDGVLEILEVKTGDDPPLTTNQMAYLPAIQVGGHIYSNDPRIEALGLQVGVPFPPMKVAIIFAPGPGLPYNILELGPPQFVPNGK